MTAVTDLAERLASVKSRVKAACERARKETCDVTMIAVTKSASPEAIREIVKLGVVDLAESRVQQFVQRAAQLAEQNQRKRLSETETAGTMTDKPPRQVRWHMIGHLQRNKVKPLIPLVHCVHSVDSLRLAEEIDAGGAKIGRRIPVLLQVNASEESQKFGVAVGAVVHLGEQIATMPGVQLAGLMTMAQHSTNEADIRTTFRRTREIFEEMKWLKIGGPAFRYLSMGMSEDFEIAIDEGSNMIRIGSALFGDSPEQPEDPEE